MAGWTTRKNPRREGRLGRAGGTALGEAGEPFVKVMAGKGR